MGSTIDTTSKVQDPAAKPIMALLSHYLFSHCNMKLGPATQTTRRLTRIGREHQLVTKAKEVHDRLGAGVQVEVSECLEVLRALSAAVVSEQYSGDQFLTQKVESLVTVLEARKDCRPGDLNWDFRELMMTFRRSVFAEKYWPGEGPVRRITQIKMGSDLDLATQAALMDPDFTTGYLGLLRMRGTLDMIRRRYCGHEAEPSRYDDCTVSRIRGNPALGPAAAALCDRVDIAAEAARPGWEASRRGDVAEPPASPPAPQPTTPTQGDDQPLGQHTRSREVGERMMSRLLGQSHAYGEVEPPVNDPGEASWAAPRPLASLGRSTMRRLTSGLLVPVTQLDITPLRDPGSHDAEVLLGAALRSLPLLVVAEGGVGENPLVVGALMAERDEPVTLLRWLLEAYERGSRRVLVVDTQGQDEYGRLALLSALAPNGLGFKPG